LWDSKANETHTVDGSVNPIFFVKGSNCKHFGGCHPHHARWEKDPVISGVMGPLQVGLFHPSDPVIRPFMWVITPFITVSGAHHVAFLTLQQTMGPHNNLTKTALKTNIAISWKITYVFFNKKYIFKIPKC